MRDYRENDDICRRHGCAENIAKIHASQIKRGWNPHPPADFRTWWKLQAECEQGVEAVRAYNCQIYRQRFLEIKQIGGIPSEFQKVKAIMEYNPS